MFSLFDKQTGDYKATGLNSKTKEEAVSDGIDLFYGEDSGLSKKDLKKVHGFSLEEKIAILETHDIFVEEHTEEMVEESFE